MFLDQEYQRVYFNVSNGGVLRFRSSGVRVDRVIANVVEQNKSWEYNFPDNGKNFITFNLLTLARVKWTIFEEDIYTWDCIHRVIIPSI